MGESNSVRVSLVQRTSFDTAAALNLLALPVRNQDLQHRVRKTTSQTLRNDANIDDLIRLGSDSGGGFELEMKFPFVSEALWYLLRALLRTTETAERSEASCTTTAGAKTITKAAIDFTAGNPVEVNDLVVVSGSSGAADDGIYRVTSVAATTLTVERDSNFTGSVGNVTVRRGARMVNGTSKYYFDVEVARLDLDLYSLYRKCVVNSWDMQIAEDIITVRVQLLGGSVERDAATSFALSVTNPTTSPVLDHLGVPTIRYNGLAASSKALGLLVNNNITPNTQIGLDGVGSFSFGSMEVSTRWTGYLASFAELTDHADNTARNLWWAMDDSASRRLSFFLPDHKWREMGDPTRGLNQTDYIEATGQAVALNQAHSIRVQRWT